MSSRFLRICCIAAASLAPITLSAGDPPEEGSAQEPTTVMERYSLVLYDFDSPIPGPLNDRILETFVFPEITPSTDIEVVGYSDIVGLEVRNRVLAQQRADTIARRIRQRVGTDGYRSLTTAAITEENALFRNDLPEGRFLSRTVVITFRNQDAEEWTDPEAEE